MKIYGADLISGSLSGSFEGLVTSASYALTSSTSINQNSNSGSLSFWQGNQTEYDAISSSADPNTIYFVV